MSKTCKACGQPIVKKTKFCPYCGSKVSKPIFAKWWFWVIVIILFISVGSAGSDSETVNHAGNSSQGFSSSVSNNISKEDTATYPVKTEYRVGDTLKDGNAKIVYISSGDYIETNEFMQPKAGNKYIFLKFAFENTSSFSDIGVSFYNFECYADGYAVEMHYPSQDELSATLSAGRATTGCVYFEVPANARKIEVEYETNLFTEEKIKFIYEGNKDSGYVQDRNTASTQGAHVVGDVVTSSNLNIRYLSCGEYISDNMFVSPAEGCRFVSCEFEFENVGSSDEYISSYDFDCYADGQNCDATFIRDDDLSATLSAGRKTRGTVTFEVPVNASTIEVEYLSNYWTSNRVVFRVK